MNASHFFIIILPYILKLFNHTSNLNLKFFPLKNQLKNKNKENIIFHSIFFFLRCKYWKNKILVYKIYKKYYQEGLLENLKFKY